MGAPSVSLEASASRHGLSDQLRDLRSASLPDLRSRFRQLYGQLTPETLSRDLIARLVAHRLQEKGLGRLDREIASQLDRLARGQLPRRRLRAGTVLVREHDGVMHEVTIVPGGFLWNGESFTSLSTIALRITGTSWNGPRFFGLRERRPDVREPAHA